MKIKFRNIIIIFIIIFNTFIIMSDDIKSEINTNEINLTIDEAVNLAIRNNLGIEIAKLNLNEKKWAMVTSWNKFIPDTSFCINLERNNKNDPIEIEELKTVGPIIGNAYGVIPETTEIINPDWNLNAVFELNLTINAMMGFEVYQTVIDWESGRLNLKIAEKKIIKTVKKYFYNLMLLQKNIEIMTKNLNEAEKRYNIAELKYKKGLISKFDLLSAKITYINMRPVLFKMENKYILMILNFKKIIGIKEEVNIVLNGILEIEEKKINEKEILSKCINNRLDVASLTLELRSLQNMRDIQIAGLTPSFFLKFSMDPTFTGDPFSDYWFGDSEYNNEMWTQIDGSFKFGISIPLDVLFPFSPIQMKIIKKQFQIKQKAVEITETKKNAEVELKSLIREINTAYQLIQELQENFKIAEETYSAALIDYEKGSRNLLEVEKVEQEFNKAEINLLNEKYNYIILYIELEYAINTDLNSEHNKKSRNFL